MARYPDRTVQAFGDFGSGDIDIEGGMTADEMALLTDPSGTDATLTDNTPIVLGPNPLFVAPATPTGSSVSLTVIMVGVAR
jgi:hypothetical protein